MLKKISSYTFLLLGFMILLNSCKKDYESIENIDNGKIEDYIKSNNITAVQDPLKSGFYYQIQSPGTGDFFTNTDTVLYDVEVKSLFNGTSYYNTVGNGNLGTRVGYTSTFLGRNIQGIRTAILGLKPGGKARVFLPSYLAFGKNGLDAIKIPSNEVIDLVVTTYPQKKQADLDDARIRKFIQDKGLTAIKDPSGVYYVVVQQGTGTEVINAVTTIKANYTGRLLDGTVFDSSTDGTFSSPLNEVISGWDVLKNFKKGAKVRLLIPSGSAYGTAGKTSIPANAVLDFDIEIVDVDN